METTRAAPGEGAPCGFLRSITCVTRPTPWPVYQHISEFIGTVVAIKRQARATCGVQGCRSDTREWSPPIARWAPSQFAPFFALLT